MFISRGEININTMRDHWSNSRSKISNDASKVTVGVFPSSRILEKSTN
jgi:hypothetical protein